jgi:oligopeptide/dipeptide ABC transporter ATP-binding protein
MSPQAALATARSKPSATGLLAIDGLSVSFATVTGRVAAVRSASVQLREGETLGIVGESGSGKTTLLLSILGLLAQNARIDGGAVSYDGHDLARLSRRELERIRGREIALIPQRAMSSLSPVTQIGSQLRRFAASVCGRPVRDDEILSALSRVGLNLSRRRLSGYPHEFSGGQLQRMLIATSALVGRPRILLADEPTSTLDATVQAQVLNSLRSVQQELGLSVIFVTHDLGVVAQLCDRVVVMYAGEVVETAEIGSLYDAPKHPYTQALLGTVPGQGTRGGALTSIPGTVADSMKIEVGCRFAPRCARSMDICWKEHPADRLAGASVVKCHLHPPAAP